jgi:hypothetical protein
MIPQGKTLDLKEGFPLGSPNENAQIARFPRDSNLLAGQALGALSGRDSGLYFHGLFPYPATRLGRRAWGEATMMRNLGSLGQWPLLLD